MFLDSKKLALRTRCFYHVARDDFDCSFLFLVFSTLARL